MPSTVLPALCPICRTCLSQYRFVAATERARGISVALGYPPVCCFAAGFCSLPSARPFSGVGCGGPLFCDLQFSPVGPLRLEAQRFSVYFSVPGCFACQLPSDPPSALCAAGPRCAITSRFSRDLRGVGALFRRSLGPSRDSWQHGTECVRGKSVALGCPPVLLQPATSHRGASLSNIPWYSGWLIGIGAYLAAFFVTLQLYVLLTLWRMLVTSIPGRSSPLALVLCLSCARRCKGVVLPLGSIGVPAKGCHTNGPRHSARSLHRRAPLGSRILLLWWGFCNYPVRVWAAPKGLSEGISAVNELVDHAALFARSPLTRVDGVCLVTHQCGVILRGRQRGRSRLILTKFLQMMSEALGRPRLWLRLTRVFLFHPVACLLLAIMWPRLLPIAVISWPSLPLRVQACSSGG